MPPTPTITPALARTTATPQGSRRWAAFLGVAVVFALFGVGMVELFQLRFEAGDVYPPYSTLRSDPLGAAAFYEALASQPGLRVERNLRPLALLDRRTTLSLGRTDATPSREELPLPTCFYLGADPYEWPRILDKPGATRLEEILRVGGRVVLTFKSGATPLTPARLELERKSARPPVNPPPTPSGSPGKKDSRAERQRRALVQVQPPDLIERWGIDFQREKPKGDGKPVFSLGKLLAPGGEANPSPDPSAAPTPPPPPTPSTSLIKGRTAVPVPGGIFADVSATSWHTILNFDVDTHEARAAGWRTLLTCDGQPVVVTRPYGMRGGELVLVSDSYFLSNEALRSEPCPALLAGLVGDKRRVIFDESHFGVQENPGLMTLARRYGLQGGLAAVGLLAALFVWRNVSSLVPPAPSAADASEAHATVTGRDSATGFLNLVRRGVPPRDLLRACLEQWRQSAGSRFQNKALATRLQEIADEEAARSGKERSPAATYRAMCATARPRR